MPIESLPSAQIIASDSIIFLIKLLIILLASFYFIFSLLILRRVSLMTETLITSVSPVLRIFSLVHSILALVVLVVIIKLLFF